MRKLALAASLLLSFVPLRTARAYETPAHITVYNLTGPTRWGGWQVPTEPGVLACSSDIPPLSVIYLAGSYLGRCWDTGYLDGLLGQGYSWVDVFCYCSVWWGDDYTSIDVE